MEQKSQQEDSGYTLTTTLQWLHKIWAQIIQYALTTCCLFGMKGGHTRPGFGFPGNFCWQKGFPLAESDFLPFLFLLQNTTEILLGSGYKESQRFAAVGGSGWKSLCRNPSVDPSHRGDAILAHRIHKCNEMLIIHTAFPPTLSVMGWITQYESVNYPDVTK